MSLPRIPFLLLLVGLALPTTEASAQRGVREIGESMRAVGERLEADSTPGVRARGGASCTAAEVAYGRDRITVCVPAGWVPLTTDEWGQPGFVRGWRSEPDRGHFSVVVLMESDLAAALRAGTREALSARFDEALAETPEMQEIARDVFPADRGVPYVAMRVRQPPSDGSRMLAMVVGTPLTGGDASGRVVFLGSVGALPDAPVDAGVLDAQLRPLFELWRSVRVR